jgi:hypothetical protein
MDSRQKIALLMGAVFALTACGQSANSALPAGALPAALHEQHAIPEYASWRDSLVRSRLPEAGCFESSYPSTTWVRVACSTEPTAPKPADEQHAVAPQNIGGAHGQLEATVIAPALISGAIGTFPVVDGVTSEYSEPKNGGKSLGPDTFTLQMNSNKFPTKACGTDTHCLGWEQFVYGNNSPTGKTPTRILIQDWLVATNGKPVTCPKNWNHSANSCFVNAPRDLDVPHQSIKNLGSISLQGEADSQGDSVFLTIGTKTYAVRNAQSDSLTDLASHWSDVQFNIYGDGDSSIATFNTGSTLGVQLQVDTGNNSTKPLCVLTSSTTAESNTLDYAPAPPASPGTYPSIVFGESNAPSRGSATCTVKAAK